MEMSESGLHRESQPPEVDPFPVHEQMSKSASVLRVLVLMQAVFSNRSDITTPANAIAKSKPALAEENQ